MALIKDTATSYGILAEYHKVLELCINWHNHNADVQIGSFVNKDARVAGADCILYRSYAFSAEAFPFALDQNNVEQAYIALKAHPDFIDAEDDL